MEGSSAFQFGRAAYRAGLLEPAPADRRRAGRTCASGCAARPTRSHALRNRISQSPEGTRVRDLERLGADVLAGVLPRLYPQMLELAYGHQDAGRPRVHRHRRLAGAGRRSWRGVLAFDGAIGSQFSEVVDGVYTGRAGRAVHLRPREGARDRGARRARGARPRELLRLLGLRVRPADAAARRPPGRGQPRPELAMAAREERWEVLRFDRLGRRLKARSGWRAPRSPAASGRRRWPRAPGVDAGLVAKLR